MAVPATVIYFTMYDHLKYSFGYREGDSSTKYIPLLVAPTARRMFATIVKKFIVEIFINL